MPRFQHQWPSSLRLRRGCNPNPSAEAGLATSLIRKTPINPKTSAARKMAAPEPLEQSLGASLDEETPQGLHVERFRAYQQTNHSKGQLVLQHNLQDTSKRNLVKRICPHCRVVSYHQKPAPIAACHCGSQLYERWLFGP